MESATLKRLHIKTKALDQQILSAKTKAMKQNGKKLRLLKEKKILDKNFEKIKKRFSNLRKSNDNIKLISKHTKENLTEIMLQQEKLAKFSNVIKKRNQVINAEVEKIKKLDCQLCKLKLETDTIKERARSARMQMELNSFIEVHSYKEKTKNRIFEYSRNQTEALSVSGDLKIENLEKIETQHLLDTQSPIDISFNHSGETTKDFASENQNQQNTNHENKDETIESGMISSLNTWSLQGQTGLELTVNTGAGGAYSLQLVERGNGIVDVRMLPDTERQRRKMWIEKKEILKQLEFAGYKVNTFKIGGGNGGGS